MGPVVSVIIPVYNAEHYLERCLESIQRQSLRDFELILVDDGSADRSPEICRRYQARDSRVQVLRQQNAGPGAARNTGLDAARGEYVTFVDSDDFAEPCMLETLHRAAEGGADCVMAGTLVHYAGGGSATIAVTKQPRLFSGEEVKQVLLDLVGTPPACKTDSLYGASVCWKLYRRRIIEENCVRFVPEDVCMTEDTVFNIDFLRHAGQVAVIPDILYHYNCAHAGSFSKSYRADRFQKELVSFRTLEDRLAAIFPRERYRLALQRLFMMRTAYILTQEVLCHDHLDRSHPMKENIRRILADPTLCGCLREYPWAKLPLLRMVLAGVMRLRLAGLLILLIRVQQRVMKSSQNL